MSVEANKQLAEAYQAAWSAGDIEQLRRMLDEECVNYNLATGEKRDLEFELDACRIWHRGFSDTHVAIQQMVAEQNKVCVHWLLTATHTGILLGLRPQADMYRFPVWRSFMYGTTELTKSGACPIR